MRKYLPWIIIGSILFIIVIYFISTYNSMSTKNLDVKESWSKVQSAYQKRLDLIPNIERTVKAYSKYEGNVLKEITEARSKISSITVTAEVLNDPALFKKFQESQNQFTGALKSVFALQEKYPDLKANEQYMELISSLDRIEGQIKRERDLFSTTVNDYNKSIVRFPANIVAGIFGFKERPYFEAEANAERAPELFKEEK